MKRAACHIHTSFSYDSVTSPKSIVEAAVRNHIDYLLIRAISASIGYGDILSNHLWSMHKIHDSDLCIPTKLS